MSGYPVILNGDHAEFEREHANTKPEDRPDWPLPSFDARDWAAAFCKTAAKLGYEHHEGNPIDEGWMVTWFANALIRGFDEANARVNAELVETRSQLDCATKALKQIEGGSFPNASDYVLTGGWQVFCEKLQAIARGALTEDRDARASGSKAGQPGCEHGGRGVDPMLRLAASPTLSETDDLEC